MKSKLTADLKNRWSAGEIHTTVGSCLLIVNPLKELAIYGKDYLDAFAPGCKVGHLDQVQRNQLAVDATKDHIFAVARDALDEAILTERNGTIVFQGASGAGKSRNFALVDAYYDYHIPRAQSQGVTPNTVDTLTNASLLVDFMTVASTKLNPLSSRAIKCTYRYIDPASRRTVATTVDIHGIEHSRLFACIHHPAGDQSCFDIMHQLAAWGSTLPALMIKHGIDLPLVVPTEALSLGHQGFALVKGCANDNLPLGLQENRLDGFVRALRATHSPGAAHKIIQALLGVLFLGNFSARDVDDKNINYVADLWGIKASELSSTLRETLFGGVEKVRKPVNEVLAVRDGMMLTVYLAVIQGIFKQCNDVSVGGQDLSQCKKIGMLDICGYEIFDMNTHGSLIINMCNDELSKLYCEDLYQTAYETLKADSAEIDPALESALLEPRQYLGRLADANDKWAEKLNDAALNRKNTGLETLCKTLGDLERDFIRRKESLGDGGAVVVEQQHACDKASYKLEPLLLSNIHRSDSRAVELLTSAGLYAFSASPEAATGSRNPGNTAKSRSLLAKAMADYKSLTKKLLLDSSVRWVMCVTPRNAADRHAARSRPGGRVLKGDNDDVVQWSDQHVYAQLDRSAVAVAAKMQDSLLPERLLLSGFAAAFPALWKESRDKIPEAQPNARVVNDMLTAHLPSRARTPSSFASSARPTMATATLGRTMAFMPAGSIARLTRADKQLREDEAQRGQAQSQNRSCPEQNAFNKSKRGRPSVKESQQKIKPVASHLQDELRRVLLQRFRETDDLPHGPNVLAELVAVKGDERGAQGGSEEANAEDRDPPVPEDGLIDTSDMSLETLSETGVGEFSTPIPKRARFASLSSPLDFHRGLDATSTPAIFQSDQDSARGRGPSVHDRPSTPYNPHTASASPALPTPTTMLEATPSPSLSALRSGNGDADQTFFHDGPPAFSGDHSGWFDNDYDDEIRSKLENTVQSLKADLARELAQKSLVEEQNHRLARQLEQARSEACVMEARLNKQAELHAGEIKTAKADLSNERARMTKVLHCSMTILQRVRPPTIEKSPSGEAYRQMQDVQTLAKAVKGTMDVFSESGRGITETLRPLKVLVEAAAESGSGLLSIGDSLFFIATIHALREAFTFPGVTDDVGAAALSKALDLAKDDVILDTSLKTDKAWTASFSTTRYSDPDRILADLRRSLVTLGQRRYLFGVTVRDWESVETNVKRTMHTRWANTGGNQDARKLDQVFAEAKSTVEKDLKGTRSNGKGKLGV